MPQTAKRTYDRASRRPVRRRAAPTPVRAVKPEVIAIADPQIRIDVSGRTFEAPLPNRAVRVGAAQDSDLVLSCPGVAATHCEIRPLGEGRFVVKDLGSGMPTLVNGIEVQQVSLKPGDVVQVGEAKVTFQAGPTAAPAAAPPASAAAPAPGKAKRAATSTSTSTPASASPAAPAAPSRAAPQGSHRLAGPLIGLAVAAALAVGIALVIGSGGEQGDAAVAERRLEDALDLYRAKDFEAARIALQDLSSDPTAQSEQRRIARYLEQTRSAIGSAENELEAMWAQRMDFDLASASTARLVFQQKHGPTFAARFDETVERIEEAQASWRRERVATIEAEVARHLDDAHFQHARAEWLSLANNPHAGFDLAGLVREGLDAVELRAGAAAGMLLDEATALAAERGSLAALRRLKARLPNFEGTSSYSRIADAVETWDARVRSEMPTVEPTRPTPGETPPESVTPEATPPTETAREAAADVLAKVQVEVEAWRFETALALLDAAPGELTAVLAPRRHDLDLARQGRDVLVADIVAHPERYRRLETGASFRVDLVGADVDGVAGAVPGGRTEYRWATMSPTRVAAIASRATLEGQPALGLAALLTEVGARDAAEPLLVAAGRGGAPTDALFALIARWRDEDVPEGGYVVHDDRYVTPTERDRLVLVARIEEATSRVRKRDPQVWTAAAEELLALGPPARPALVAALKARRGDVVDALAKMKVFSSGRTKAKLFEELVRRRAHALALIRDERAWPYPNPSGQNTEEVAARVDAVREVWERPFDVIVAWSDEAKEHLSTVSEVDAYLVRAQPDYKPTLDAVRQRVNHELDMPAVTPDGSAKSVREYSLKVLAFNEKVPTTATREEKDCVRAVNEYRMMMGHQAVKINERLTRAARGHSHHMRENGYFAHNVPTAKGASGENRTPGDRARAQGYGGGVGENIARGTWSGRDAFNAWFHSSGHHRNMVNAGWTEMGAGRSGGSWWTQLFGRASGKSLDVPDALADPAAFYAPEPEDDSGRPRQPGDAQLPDEPPVIPPDE